MEINVNAYDGCTYTRVYLLCIQKEIQAYIMYTIYLHVYIHLNWYDGSRHTNIHKNVVHHRWLTKLTNDVAKLHSLNIEWHRWWTRHIGNNIGILYSYTDYIIIHSKWWSFIVVDCNFNFSTCHWRKLNIRNAGSGLCVCVICEAP